jgi:hypothetical protein
MEHYCDLCCWPKCEHDLDNITQLWKKYLKIKFASDKNYSKLNISSTLPLEITKSLQETWFIQGFSNGTKDLPKFPYYI